MNQPMNQLRAPWLIGLAAVTVLFVRSPTQPALEPRAASVAAAQVSAATAKGGTTEAPPVKRTDSGAARAQASRREYTRLYRDLLGIETPPRQQAKTGATRVVGSLAAQPVSLEISTPPEELAIGDGDLLEIAEAAKGSCYHLEFMIALVADPIDSALASDFDLTMSALQWGLAEEHYRLERQWLPWVESEPAGDKQARKYRETAGMMLFRRDWRSNEKPPRPGHQLLAVFVVGETLKLGVSKPAFVRAVDFILALHVQDRRLSSSPPECAATPPPARRVCYPEIPVLGPSSSGSVDSLRLALERAPRRTCFRIVSGSASAPNLKERLEEPLPGHPDVKVRFSRTVVPDDVLAAAGLGFLRDQLGWDLDRAAMLVERDTAYGSFFATDRKLPLSKITKLFFPSGIYALRNAWEASGGFAPPVQAIASNPRAFATPKTALDVSLADQRTPVDVVPELSPLTARIYDMALADLMRQIASEGFSYIGILATDLKDQLFLAEQIRRWAPNVILFVVDNNLLYVHPQYTSAMSGTLTISSFPLAVEGRHDLLSPATFGPKIRRQFASERQEGTFLAVRSLVPGSPPPPGDVWIAASGNYAIWPLARLHQVIKESALPEGYPPAVDALGPSPEVGPCRAQSSPNQLDSWTTKPSDRLDISLAFLAFLVCLVSTLLRREALLWARVQVRTRVLLSGAAALLCLAGACIAGLWIVRLWSDAKTGEDLTWRTAGLLFVLLSAFGYLSRPFWFTRRLGGWLKCALEALGLAALTSVVTWSLFTLWQVDAQGLFYLRARAFTGGVSPLVALAWLAAACFFWLVVELKRQWVLRRHQVAWPLATYSDPVLRGCPRLAEQIESLLRATLPSGSGTFWASLALVALPIIFLLTRMQPIGESRCYGLVFVGLAAALSILSIATLVRFLVAWVRLRQILRHIERTDLLIELRRVRPEIGWKPTDSAWYQPSFTAVIGSAKRLQRLIDRQVLADPDPGGVALPHLLDRILTAASQGWIYDELDSRDALNERCNRAFPALAGNTHNPGVRRFYAIRLIAYLRHVFTQLRYSVMGAMGSGLALIVGLSTYAFEPKEFATLALFAVVVVASIATLVVFVQMERDATLSAIGGSDAGKVSYDWSFLSKLLIYTVLPVLGLVVSQFPSMGRLLNSFFDPLVRVLGAGS